MSSLDDDEIPGVEALTDDQLAAVVRLVRALVDHDEPALHAADAYELGDPYQFTRNWRLWDQVDLVMPPRDPRTWSMDVEPFADDPGHEVTVQMYTEQEGMSELTLGINLFPGPDAKFRLLHVP